MPLTAKELNRGTKRVNCTLPIAEYAKLEALAKSEAISPTTYATQMLRKGVRENIKYNRQAKEYMEGYETINMFDKGKKKK